jgi:EAL domain-containing protein (putative c-di-GMP-specific phosphodiesterase class I)/GGDEF domain-containing protein
VTALTRFQKYASALALLALLVLVPVGLAGTAVGDHLPVLLVLVALTVAGELLPISLPRKGSFTDELTVSAAFALAIVLMFGPSLGVAAYVLGCAIGDARNRTSLDKALFNASQSVLSVSAAAAAFALVAGHVTTGDIGADLGAALAAAAAFGVVDNVLTAIGVAMLGSNGVLAHLRQNLALFGWTEGSLFALVPVVVAAASSSVWLVPLLFVPVAGIYVGARQGMANAYRALYDEVTGIPSRALLVRRIAEAAEELASDEVLALGVVAVDDLKPVLDTLGPGARDTAARGVAKRLAFALGEGYTLARVTAEQFAVLAPVHELEAFERTVGAAVHEAFSRPFEVGDLPLDMRAFTGFAAFGAHGETAEALLSSAAGAAALARSERAEFRRAPVRRASPALDRLILAGELRSGIERGELVLEYQLKQALREGGQDAVEALVRWNHPSLGMLAPSAFIPLAEDTGLIRSVTHWVLGEAIRQSADWRATGHSPRMGVNLSARDVTDPALPALVERLLVEHGVPGSALQLEITETQLLGDAPDAHAVLDRLARIGVSWAIDDYGTGYSSLSQLQRLPVDEIKIDRSFVVAMDGDDAGEAIVRSTVDLARALDVRVTAEGVETAAALARVAEIGCDYAQGFYVARPEPAAARRFAPAEVLPLRRANAR